MSTFMQLPVELQKMIYRHCLVVGKVFPNPRPSRDQRYNGWETYEKPHVALLRVNKAVYEGAREVLFEKENLFVVPRGFKDWLSHAQAPVIHTLTPRPLLKPKSISISFTFRDIGGSHNQAVTTESFATATSYSPTSLVGYHQQHSLQNVHDTSRQNLLQVWNQKLSWLCSLPKLERLELDMSEFCCPFGCCFGAELFNEFDFMDFDAPKWPKDVIFTGCANEAVDRALMLAVKAFQAACAIHAANEIYDDLHDQDWEGPYMLIYDDGTPSWLRSGDLTTADERLDICNDIIEHWHTVPNAAETLLDFALVLGEGERNSE